jgi:hypothetical protein
MFLICLIHLGMILAIFIYVFSVYILQFSLIIGMIIFYLDLYLIFRIMFLGIDKFSIFASNNILRKLVNLDFVKFSY